MSLILAGIFSAAGIYDLTGTLRVMAGILLIFVLPGYAASLAVYPRVEDLSGIERLALSLGLSIAVVLFAILLANHVLGVPLTAEGITLTLIAAIVLLLIIRMAHDLVVKK